MAALMVGDQINNTSSQLLFSVQLFSLCVIVINTIYARCSGDLRTASISTSIGGSILAGGLIFIGEGQGTTIYWLFPLLFVNFVFLGAVWGAAIGSIIVSLLLIQFMFPVLIPSGYTAFGQLRGAFAIISFSTVCFFSEFFRYRYHKVLSADHSNQADELSELQQRSDIQDALNDLLHISLQPGMLNAQMQQILERTLSIPWLSLEQQGCIFLRSDNGDRFELVVQHNLDGLLNECAKTQASECKAGESQRPLFKECVDHHQPKGMAPHGHYIIPLVSLGSTLGILNLYVKHGHARSEIELEFLDDCGKILTGLIERKHAENELQILSSTDDLTGVPNRRSFLKKLAYTIARPETSEQKVAVLFLDLDHFKIINDTHGHDHGDQILIQACERMRESLRGGDTVGRLGGDEFVVLLESPQSEQLAIEIASELKSAISKPYQIKGKELQIGVSIGISLYPDHGDNASELLKSADNALYSAKVSRNAIRPYRSGSY